MDRIKPILVIAATFALVASLVGCAGAKAKSKSRSKPLTLFAYNYTDRAVLDITVDGVWMGWAGAYTNSGTAMGPRAPSNRKKEHTIEVKWSVSASYYDLTSNKYVDDGELVRERIILPVKYPYPEDPNELILHFYLDGHVEAEMIGKQENPFDFRRVPIPVGHKEHGRK